MSAKLVDFTTTLPIPCDRVLEGALGKLEKCIVIGRYKSGELYFAASEGSMQDAFWEIDKAKHELLDEDL